MNKTTTFSQCGPFTYSYFTFFALEFLWFLHVHTVISSISAPRYKLYSWTCAVLLIFSHIDGCKMYVKWLETDYFTTYLHCLSDFMFGNYFYTVFQYNSTFEYAFLKWEWPSTGTGCPGSLWSLPLWTHSKEIWKCTWATGCKWSFLSRGIGPDNFQRSLLISTIKLFCDKPFIAVLRSKCSARFRI